MIANIALDDALILPHHANPRRIEFSGTTAVHRAKIVELAERFRLPAIYSVSDFPRSGGLFSYGFDQDEQFRQAASYVARILAGAKPAELPVQTPTKFNLVINLKTAKALGLDVPSHLQQLADEVIE